MQKGEVKEDGTTVLLIFWGCWWFLECGIQGKDQRRTWRTRLIQIYSVDHRAVDHGACIDPAEVSREAACPQIMYIPRGR